MNDTPGEVDEILMLHYPKIPDASSAKIGPCIAFEKYDGTNLHWDWDRDFGWHAFGTRRDCFNLTEQGIEAFERAHGNLVGAAAIFQSTLAEGLDRIFRDVPVYLNYPSFKVFTEFLGPNSFAGMHQVDEPKLLVLFDVEAEGFGILSPFQFVEDFSHLPSARVVYQGKFSGKLSEDVRRGFYNVKEGVVIKGGTGGMDLWMVKVKTNTYLQRLKEMFREGWENYWE